MSAFPSGMGELTRRLLAFEAEHAPRSDGHVDEAVQVCDKLRGPLSKLAGVFGFTTLLSRALALAKREVPSLQAVKVRPDGSLEGWVKAGRDRDQDEGSMATGGEVLVARLLGLLVTFIGEALTLRLVHEAWPDLSEDGAGWRMRVES